MKFLYMKRIIENMIFAVKDKAVKPEETNVNDIVHVLKILQLNLSLKAKNDAEMIRFINKSYDKIRDWFNLSEKTIADVVIKSFDYNKHEALFEEEHVDELPPSEEKIDEKPIEIKIENAPAATFENLEKPAVPPVETVILPK